MMAQTGTDLLQSPLREALPEFEMCCRRAIEGVLGKPTYSPRDFRLSSCPGGAIPPGCIIHSGNDRFGALLLLGVDRKDYAALLPEAGNDEVAADAIGEIANVIAGNFLSRSSFANRFGPMFPTPPAFIPGCARPRESRSLQGILAVNTVKLNLEFLIHPLHKDPPK